VFSQVSFIRPKIRLFFPLTVLFSVIFLSGATPLTSPALRNSTQHKTYPSCVSSLVLFEPVCLLFLAGSCLLRSCEPKFFLNGPVLVSRIGNVSLLTIFLSLSRCFFLRDGLSKTVPKIILRFTGLPRRAEPFLPRQFFSRSLWALIFFTVGDPRSFFCPPILFCVGRPRFLSLSSSKNPSSLRLQISYFFVAQPQRTLFFVYL